VLALVPAVLAGALLAACGTAAPALPPPTPTTCFVRAQGDNAVLQVTGVDAAQSCHAFQSWSLKDAPSRILDVTDARPDPATLKMPLLPTAEEQQNDAPTVKQTCAYTLGGTTYTVSDTGGQSIGGGWCKHFYALSVEAQQAADARRR